MSLTSEDIATLWLTFRLATTTTLILFVFGTPLAWWLARSRSKAKGLVSAAVVLPMVLPPSVLGFYLLITLGANGPIGKLTKAWGLGTLPFTFEGLVVASVLYSLPFWVQPLQAGFEALDNDLLETAATLHASAFDRFHSIALPLTLPSFFVAAIMTFTHTVGEFGVVLMMGGNIPGETRVAAIQIYDHVESFQYQSAHSLSAFLLLFTFATLIVMQWLKARKVFP